MPRLSSGATRLSELALVIGGEFYPVLDCLCTALHGLVAVLALKMLFLLGRGAIVLRCKTPVLLVSSFKHSVKDNIMAVTFKVLASGAVKISGYSKEFMKYERDIRNGKIPCPYKATFTASSGDVLDGPFELTSAGKLKGGEYNGKA